MPIYEYACVECGQHIEVVQSMSDPPLAVCAACGGRLRKVFSPIGIVFKSSTSAKDGASTGTSTKETTSARSESSSSSSDSSGSTTRSDSSSSSKPAAKPAEKSA